jgi:hypothetical protein
MGYLDYREIFEMDGGKFDALMIGTADNPNYIQINQKTLSICKLEVDSRHLRFP